MVTVVVMDDSGAIQETLDIAVLDILDFEQQLPEGWTVEVM